MKRKIVALIVLLALLTVSVSASNKFELTQVHYPIYANGELVVPDELPVLSYQDRTYVPLRKLSEASGLSVYFDDAQQSISIYNSPLIEAQVYAAVANAYKQAIDIVQLFDQYNDGLTNCMNNIVYSGPNVSYYLEKLPYYIYEFIPLQIEELSEEIVFVDELYKAMGVSLGASPVDDLYTRLYYAQEALKNAELAYQVLVGYANGIYTYSYFENMYYGRNNDGYMSMMFDLYSCVKEKASVEFDKYINLALGV